MLLEFSKAFDVSMTNEDYTGLAESDNLVQPYYENRPNVPHCNLCRIGIRNNLHFP